MNTRIAKNNAQSVVLLNILDVENDIRDTSDRNMLTLSERIKSDYEYYMGLSQERRKEALNLFKEDGIEEDDYETTVIYYLKNDYDISEINVVNRKGIITNSTTPTFLGFDMSRGSQSSEFLCLLGDEESYVQRYQPISYDRNIEMKYAGIKLQNGGFIQVAYDSDRFQDDMDEIVHGAVKNRHVGNTGFCLIVNEDGKVVSSPKGEYNGLDCASLGFPLEVLESHATGNAFEGIINDELFDCVGEKVEGYYIFTVLPRSETISSLRKTLATTYCLEMMLFAAVLIIVYRGISRLVADRLNDVAVSLDEIARGNLDVEVNVSGSEEFESLSKNINTTVTALRESGEREVARINQDLEYAKSIQRSALPMLFPPFPDREDFEIYATMDPAKEVGGDFFDFELINSNQLGFCVADVSGKGIPAALFMMRAKTLIKSYGVAGLNAAEILEKVNNELSSNNEAGMFVTCWLGILDTDTGVVEYANAGHNPPFVRHSDGKFECLRTARPGFVLGGMSDIKYKKYELFLDKGDEIFVYTDGVTEATNSDLVLFGEDRLKEQLDMVTAESCEDKCIHLRESIDEFVGDAPQFDDITMLSIRYFGDVNVCTVEADISNYDETMAFIESRLEEMNCPVDVLTKFNVVSDEILSNIIKFAYGDATGYMSVIADKVQNPNGISLTYVDRGVPFNPLENPDPDTTLAAEDREIGKLGLLMVKKLMDKVEYEYSDGNKLTVTKYF